MTRTLTSGLFAVLAAGLVAYGGSTPQQPEPRSKQPVGGEKVTPFLECARACDACARVCRECEKHCADLAIGGQKHHQVTMRYCQDCGTVCAAASAILSREGPLNDTICLACAQACKRCGDECEKHGGDDPLMRRCADECRRCEKACLTMLKNSGRDPNIPPGK
ncbi:MAG: four-helix bundle copper-binding protein [Gemmataceae bacterium]|nr:four-helix bundle copper-binding protein [Gemmataceae bacterium]